MTEAKITSKTLIPISFVITIVGGAVWLTTIFANVRANAKVIEDIKVKQEKVEKKINEERRALQENLTKMQTKLGNIEGQLSVLIRKFQ